MKFLKTTIIGGLLFLVPVVAVVIVIGKALNVMKAVAEPAAKVLPIDSLGGVAIVNIIAALIVLLICFLAGLLARAKPARKFADAIENALLSKIPGYTLAKGVTDKLKSSDADGVRAALVTLGSSSRVSIEIERVSGDRVVVYVPSSPNPWTGEVYVVKSDQVEHLDCPITAVIDHAEQLGGGSQKYLGAPD
ncbi:MAG: DUF502 domain-containing protein [Gammaproteobacteria bacterium]|jgi:uncharacterized membrane protein|nr:DUF502 domain-containing protein [Gammaproteobacteria bacterium]